jgi:hypothetical protein
VADAAGIYRHIAQHKDPGQFVTEVSMDETDSPQTPPELLLILAAIADAGIPIQTIAPKFTGRFNKGVDYVGDVDRFETGIPRRYRRDRLRRAALWPRRQPETQRAFRQRQVFHLWPIRRALRQTGAGIHVKTAGTTWLEELIGLAEAGPEGLATAKEIYASAYEHCDELCAPYAAVIDIDRSRLPSSRGSRRWTSEQYASTVRHDRRNPLFNPHVRQLLHVGYKVAAKMGERYTRMLDACEESIARNVTVNLYERHIEPLFLHP